MNASLHAVSTAGSAEFELEGLIGAIESAPGDDAMVNLLSAADWKVLAPYLQVCTLTQSQVLFTEGSADRTLYFVERGSLSVHVEDAQGRLRLAIVGPGSVVGEGAFFSHRPRSATVQAGSPCMLWSLSPLRFSELAHRQPAVALNLSLAAGGVLAKRLANRRRRVAAT